MKNHLISPIVAVSHSLWFCLVLAVSSASALREPQPEHPYQLAGLEESLRSEVATASAGLEEWGVRTGFPEVSASLLPIADADEFPEKAIAARRAGAARIHFDVIQVSPGNSVVQSADAKDTTKTFTPARLRKIKEAGRQQGLDIPVDVHLMVAAPSRTLLEKFLQAGADGVSVHWESYSNPDPLLKDLRFIHQTPARAILAVNPDIDIDRIGRFLQQANHTVDMISLGAVTPGAGGQRFQPRVLGQLRRLRERYGYRGMIQVDGGMEPESSAPLARAAGADVIVAGSAFFGKQGQWNGVQLRAAYEALRGPVRPSSIEIVQRCLKCGAQESGFVEMGVCRVCRGDLLEFEVAERVPFLDSIAGSQPGMWRYGPLLPVRPEHVVTSGEGNTPVVPLEELGRKLGIRLYVKLDSENPTGTFKDREGSFVVSRARAAELDNLVLQSTGNTALAVSYYAGLAGLRSYAFVPARSAYKLIGPPLNRGNKIILVQGDPIDVKEYATRFAAAHNFPKVSPFHQRSEANTTQAYEIGEAILREEIPPPDFYVQTVAAGMGPIGFYLGMERLVRWTDRQILPPRIIGVQISEFAPVHHAWEQDLEEVGPEGKTPTYGVDDPFEPTLHTTNAPSYYPHLRAILKRSQGALTKVEPEEVRSAEPELRSALAQAGYPLLETEWSSFIGYAGLVKEIQTGRIPKGSAVLLMITGKGPKSVFRPIEPDAVITPKYDPRRLLQQLESGETVRADSRSRALQVARAIAEYEGWAMGKVMEAIYLGRMTKALSERHWTPEEEKLVQGTRRFLISGTMGVKGELARIIQEGARRYLNQKYPKVGFRLVPMGDLSGIASAEGAFHFIPAERLRRHIEEAPETGRLGVILTDVGGTKTDVMVSEVDRNGSLVRPGEPLIIQEIRTPTWDTRELMFEGIARTMKEVVHAAKGQDVHVLPVAGVAFAAAFVKPGGGIMYDGTGNPVAVGSGFDLAPNMPGSFPSRELEARLQGIEVFVVNDGVAQFRYLLDAALRKDEFRPLLLGEKAVSVAPGTGLGAGFGQVDSEGQVELFPMTHISDLVVGDFQRGIRFAFELDGHWTEVSVHTPGPRRWAKDFLSGRAVEKIMIAVDRNLLQEGREPVFLPFVEGYSQMTQAEVEAALDPDNRRTPLTARLLNDLLAQETGAGLEEKEVKAPVHLLRFIVDTEKGNAQVLRLLQLAVQMRLQNGLPVQAAGVAAIDELKLMLSGMEDPAARELLQELVYTYIPGDPQSYAEARMLAEALVPNLHPELVITEVNRATIAWFLEAVQKLGILVSPELRREVEATLSSA